MIRPITFTPPVDKSCRDKTRVDRSCAFQTLSALSFSPSLSLSLYQRSLLKSSRKHFVSYSFERSIAALFCFQYDRDTGKVWNLREIMLPRRNSHSCIICISFFFFYLLTNSNFKDFKNIRKIKILGLYMISEILKLLRRELKIKKKIKQYSFNCKIKKLN